MGLCRSKAKVYFATHTEHEKMRPVLAECYLRDREAMHLFCAWERMQHGQVNGDGTGDSSITGDDFETVGFRMFVKAMNVQPTRFVLNVFANGCQVPRKAFPKVKEGAMLSLENFLRCAAHLCARNEEGLRTLVFSLYKNHDNQGILVDNAIQCVHDMYEIVGGGQVKGAQERVEEAEIILRDRASWDEKAGERRSAATPFSWEEFDTLVRKKRFIIDPVFGMQSALRKSMGGLSMWQSVQGRVGTLHSGMLKDVKWAPNRSITFGSDHGNTNGEEEGLRSRGT